MKLIIRVENLSKQYRLGNIGTGTLSNDMKRWWYRMRGKEDPFLKIGETNDRSVKGESEYVWALKNINFEVMPGEVLGIIGKNGAGKSTLLKILSKVTGPTTGKIEFNGRIGSLLEVGTGFHPELTGRENIFLNGAILGMTKAEIRKKLDEIIDFAGVERYIDTPVKRYSSGMTVRLGFAVAAHLEPEILVVDEVLAVGDAEFQKKAIGKMQDVSRNEGRTVLFVSHNMASVKSLCTRALILKDGELWKEGDTNQIVMEYIKGDNDSVHKKSWNTPYIDKEGFQLFEIGIRARNMPDDTLLQVDQELEFYMRYRLLKDFESLHITLLFKDDEGNRIFSTSGTRSGLTREQEKGDYLLLAYIPDNFLNWGTFYLDLYIVVDIKNVIHIEQDIISFALTNKPINIGQWMGRAAGNITPYFEWNRKKLVTNTPIFEKTQPLIDKK